MSTSVLPQLLEVDSELSAQATALEAQLTELQEKRKGIQTVIAMFESGHTPAMKDIVAVTSSEGNLEPLDESVTKPAKETSFKKTSAQKATAKTAKATATAKSKTIQAKRSRSTKAKVVATAVKNTQVDNATDTAASERQSTRNDKRSSKTAKWQHYVQESYRKAPLPDVIGGVLQAQPGTIFKIADVMNAVFQEDMPKNHFLTARNRVSNILSAGAREGNWYRGRGGTYSVSEKAVKAS